MTNRSMNWKNKPFLLSPTGKDYLWGGDRLNKDFHKNIDMIPLAETWECSTHPDGVSIVASGEHLGQPLDVVLAEHPEYLGSHPVSVMNSINGDGHRDTEHPLTLPVLVKFIDARQNLSVQVHPDDDYARIHENGSPGKTEMWYVLDAAPNAHLVYGFNRDMDDVLLRQSLKKGNIEKYLQKIPVQKDDVFYIEAGTVHAIGAGVLLAEVQENSNLTYRLCDYDRVDRHGSKRPLHIEKAVQVLNYKSSENPRQPMRVLRYQPGCASEFLCRCKYFQVERMLINTTTAHAAPECSATAQSFQVLLCLEGSGEIVYLDNADLASHESLLSDNGHSALCDSLTPKKLPFTKGSCIFVPADSVPLQLNGKAQLLKISC